MNPYTGVYIVHVMSTILDTLFAQKFVTVEEVVANLLIEDEPLPWLDLPNVCLVLKTEGRSSGLVKVSKDKNYVLLVPDYSKKDIYSIRPHNKEQNLYFDHLLDPEILCVVAEGRPGSGKTLCALAAALHSLHDKSTPYERIILTRPMDPVGTSLGALPGDEKEKLGPYLGNFYSNFEQIMKDGLKMLEVMIQKGAIVFVPIQLIGGVSWHNSYIIADEVQSLTKEQMYALGTRPAKGSKLVLLGDSAQRYGKREALADTGLHSLVNSHLLHESPLTAYIKLIKQERSPLADLFYNIYVDEAK